MSATAIAAISAIAVEAGLPLIKGIIERRAGRHSADLAERLVKIVARQAGVHVPGFEQLPKPRQTAAVKEAEAAPETRALYDEAHKLSTALLMAEMDKGPLWTWGWRPAFMWLFFFLWLWALVIQPVVNGLTGGNIAAIDLTILLSVNSGYMALYMGGHTVKQLWG